MAVRAGTTRLWARKDNFMNDERWTLVDRLLGAALEREPDERAAFLREACGDDEALRRDVESLIAHASSGAGVVSTPAVVLADEIRSAGTSMMGRHIGPYAMAARLGAGGMGEVYRARDSKLGRDVAIKILPRIFATDPDRRTRLDREARLLAALNHPHIGAIYGLEELDGTPALVLELVEGDTLAERLAKGPLKITEALTIAHQIADALDAAHEKGIVHRDLKPANIKITPDGIVKVLDFGLAKAASGDTSGRNLTQSPTFTLGGTHAGIILGTAPYMSPEQARGEPADQRTDIWAFGCVLYEMLTGRMAFGAPTATETLARVLEGHADLDALPAATPAAIRRLIRRCLERSPRDRVRHIGDARADIEDVRSGEPALTGAPIVLEAKHPRRVLWAAATIGLAILAAAAAWFGARSIAPERRASVLIPFDVPRVEGLSGAPITRNIALSPEGSRLAYATASSLRIRALHGDGKDEPLPVNGDYPFFSPDGEWLAFFNEKGLQKIPAGGGAVELITAERSGRERPFGGSWGTAGAIVISAGGGLLRVSAEGGATEVVAEPDTAAGEVRYAWPQFLPDGRSVLFTILSKSGLAADASIAVIDLTTRQQKTILQGGHAPRYLPTGHLLYASGARLHAVGFDDERHERRGASTPVEGVQIAAREGFNADFDVSPTGTLAYLPPTAPRLLTMAWVDPRNGREEPITAEPWPYNYPRISPDGTRVALDIRGENRDIWVWHFGRQIMMKIASGPTEDLMPAWSPDSTRVFFGSDRGGRAFQVFSVAADGAGSAQREFAGRDSYMPLHMPAADTLLAFASGVGAPTGDVAMLTLGREPQARTLLGGEGSQGTAEVSPDRRWVTYQSNESGQPEVYVRPYRDVDRQKEQISRGGGIQALWGPAGSNQLFYWTLKGFLKVVSVTSTPDLRIGTARDVPLGNGYVVPGGLTSWVYGVSPVDGRLLLFKPVPQPGGGLTPIKVVVNWSEELMRLVPTK